MALTRSTTVPRDGKINLHMCLCRSFCTVIVLTLYLEVVAFQTPLAVSRKSRSVRLPLWDAFDDASVTLDRVRDARFCSPLLEEGYPPVVDEYETPDLPSWFRRNIYDAFLTTSRIERCV